MSPVLIFFHVVGAAFWVGGLLVYVFALLPGMTALSPPERGKFTGAFLKRYAPLNWVAIILVAVTGLFGISGGIGYAALFGFDTRYGTTLLIKIIFVLALGCNGAYLGLGLGPKLAAFARPQGSPPPAGPAPAGPPLGPPPELVALQKRMAKHTWLQVILAFAVVLLHKLP